MVWSSLPQGQIGEGIKRFIGLAVWFGLVDHRGRLMGVSTLK